MSDLERMKELVEQLDAAAESILSGSKELMSNKEYDELMMSLPHLKKRLEQCLQKARLHMPDMRY